MSIIMRTSLTFEDRVDELKDVSDRWVAATRSEEGVTAFDAYIDEASGKLIFIEQYKDSDAFMVHKDLVSPDLRTELYSIASFESWEIYGDLSEELLAIASAGGGRVHSHVATR